jgi:small-conductance mechanosensitive channel
MKLFRLFIKGAILFFLMAIRLGELDLTPALSVLKFKYRSMVEFYIDRLADIIIFLVVLDFLQWFVVIMYRRRKKIRGDDNFIIGVGHIYSIVLVTGILFGILSLFQIDFKSLFTSMSIIFAGLAILTKDYISNMINGMILTFSGEMTIGDNIQIGIHKGKIIDITLQKIHLLNDDDDVIFIPNNLFHTMEVVNYTKREIKRTSIEFEIEISHLNSVEEVERMLVDTLKPFAELIQEESYYLRVAEVRKASVLMKFQYILKEPNKEMERVIRRKTVRRIVEFISGREKIIAQLPELPE